MNFSRATFVLVMAALVLLAALQFKSRAKNEHFTETQKALSELRLQIESQQQLLTELQSRIETSDRYFLASAASADPASSSAALLDRILTMLQEQSNTLAAVQHQLWVTPAESPEQASRRAETGLTLLRQRHAEESQKLKAALEKLDALRLSLSVPDEIAAVDAGLVAYDSRLVPYREFFEARRSCEELRRLTQVLHLKLAAEQIDASLPASR